METRNCNLYKEKDYDVYCGRGKGIKNDPIKCSVGEYGWLGNPIAIGKECLICHKTHTKGGDTLPCYESYLKDRLKNPDFKAEFMKLKGKKLACFCKPNPCHTDIMIQYIEDPNTGN